MKTTQLALAHDLVIVGIARRTTPDDAAADIPAFWRRFMEEDVVAKVSELRAGNDGYLYAVYCDYASDHRGPYTMVLGLSVDAATPIPPGMRRVRVPAGTYASFAVSGDPAEVIWKAWAYVNTEWSDRQRRRYIADYERYPLAAMTPTSVEADIVVGID